MNFIDRLFDKLQGIKILLTISFLVTALILVFAIKANLANEKALHTALQDQVRFASWVYDTQVNLDLNSSISQTFNLLLNSVNRDQNGEFSLDFNINAFNKPVNQQNENCDHNYLKPIQSAFLFDKYTDHFTILNANEGLNNPKFENWIRNEFKSLSKTTGSLYIQTYTSVDGIEYLVVVYQLPGGSATGSDILVGFKNELKNLQKLFEWIWKNDELLPGVLPSGQKNEHLMAVMVTTQEGSVLFSSGEPAKELISTQAIISEPFSFLNSELAMIQENVPNVLLGGLAGQSNLILFILFMLAAGVSVIAFIQFKKESQLTRMRSDFVSSVSHELRTPVTQIRMFSETLLNGRIHNQNETQQSLQIIEKESRRLTLLISNILDFSKKEKSTFSASPDIIRIDKVIRNTVKAFKPLADSASNRIELNIEPVTAFMDPAGFRQILINVLDNAVKYGPINQTIRIKLYKFEGTIILSITDEGPGIPKKNHSKVWEPYWRYTEPYNNNVTGSGIGLAIVKEYLDQMDGTAEIRNLPEKGTEFLLQFPVNTNC